MRFAGGRGEVLNFNPLVALIDGFASPEECAALIDAVQGRTRPASITYDGVGRQVSGMRTGTYGWLAHSGHPVAAGLCLRLSVLLRLPFAHAETLQVLHYLPGQAFDGHEDAFTLTASNRDEVARQGGQRVFTTILYLNRVEAGGATAFPRLGITVSPEPGRLLVFGNCIAGSDMPSVLAEHAGLPVEAGEKWAATFWWREAPYVP